MNGRTHGSVSDPAYARVPKMVPLPSWPLYRLKAPAAPAQRFRMPLGERVLLDGQCS